MAVKLHRCRNLWVKFGGHPCWRVQKALNEAGVDYVVVPYPWPSRDRGEIERLSGQRSYPVIEFEDGSIYRDESKEMVETIKSGRLMEQRGRAPAQQAHDHSGHDHDHNHDHDHEHEHEHEHEHQGPPA